jgi:GNAT superfamily N-acetyltransferase
MGNRAAGQSGKDFVVEEVTDIDTAWPELVALFRGQIDFHLPYKTRTLRPDWEQRWREHLKQDTNRLLLVARQDGRVVGLVNAYFTDDYGLFQEAFGFIDDAFVLEEARGQGIGTALLQRAESWCQERGASELRLQAMLRNELAMGFWQRRGFVPEFQRFVKPFTEATP